MTTFTPGDVAWLCVPARYPLRPEYRGYAKAVRVYDVRDGLVTTVTAGETYCGFGSNVDHFSATDGRRFGGTPGSYLRATVPADYRVYEPASVEVQA